MPVRTILNSQPKPVLNTASDEPCVSPPLESTNNCVCFALGLTYLDQINIFMHPQVVIVDGSYVEESFFLRVMRAETGNRGITLIDPPGDSLSRLKWIAKLDSSSLAGMPGSDCPITAW